ncbi:hypothetical protein [Sediminibacterium goheungense]|uniref:DUF4367 domain-containing protein n=1 Tax=Sediminibacterium goheungense TaxID=1086393 RepID=A0A4R6J1R7_9BACT|nr:hypothetical protein [Sediminibacterium goheungense]TDO28701.1 hypothetical protein BC659_0781 [Sediminibacterium goheungense]
MKKVLAGYLFIHICSCMIGKSIVSVNCRLNDPKGRVIQLQLPKYVKKTIVSNDAEVGIEYTFWYRDSTAIYVSTFEEGGTLNYGNIRNKPMAFSNRFMSDTIDLTGIDSFGKLWREVKKGDLFYGYLKVDSLNKLTFDKALESIVVK